MLRFEREKAVPSSSQFWKRVVHDSDIDVKIIYYLRR